MKKFFIACLMIGLIFSMSHIADAQSNSVTLLCVFGSDCSTETITFAMGDYRISVNDGAISTLMLQGQNLNIGGLGWFWGMNISGVGSSDLILGDYSFGGPSDSSDGVYYSENDALAGSFGDFVEISLASATDLTFYVNDPDRDNNGSLTVAITTPVVPEPISSILFLVGGSTLAARRFMRRKKIDRQ